MVVGEVTVKVETGVRPKNTAVAPVRFVPVIVIAVPPLAGPVVGLMLVIEGI